MPLEEGVLEMLVIGFSVVMGISGVIWFFSMVCLM